MSSRAIKSLALMAIFAGVSVNLPAPAQDAPGLHGAANRNFPDMSKMKVEFPVKGLLGRYKDFVSADFKPIKSSVQQEVKPAVPVKTLGSSQKLLNKNQQNEKVEPGKVRWHKAIQTAMDASRQSGKPVLLFQMMGHLDDRFC